MKTRRYIFLAGSTMLLWLCFCPPVLAGDEFFVGTAQAAKDLIINKCRIYSFYLMVWSVGAGLAVLLLGFAMAFLDKCSGIRLMKTGVVVAVSGAVAHSLLANAQSVAKALLQAVQSVLNFQ